jgi:SPP1 family predicted phage head-tail adaptor
MSNYLVENAGQFNKAISIVRNARSGEKDSRGFPITSDVVVLNTDAMVKTTRGFTLIANGSDFEKATTNFTIRFPADIEINRDMFVLFKGKRYSIQYVNNVDEADVILELQAKEVTH